MQYATASYLKSLGQVEPICENCMSESFDRFVAFGSQVIACECCGGKVISPTKADRGFSRSVAKRRVTSSFETQLDLI